MDDEPHVTSVIKSAGGQERVSFVGLPNKMKIGMRTRNSGNQIRLIWSIAWVLAIGLGPLNLVAQQPALPAGPAATDRLADFGPVTTPAEIQSTFKKATAALAETGGILFLSPAESKQLNVENTSQHSFRTPAPPAPAKNWGAGNGFTVVEVSEKGTTIKVPQMTGLNLKRTLRLDSNDSLGHWTTDHLLKLDNKLIHGSNSYLDWITEAVAKGKDARFYVPTIRGIRPGQFLNAHAGPDYNGGAERLYVKSVGYDNVKKSYYFIADAELDHVARAIVHNKNNVGLIWLNQTINSDQQTYDVMLRRNQYAGGDTYMFFGWYDYMSDIHSAAGDENGTIYGGYIHSLLNNFRAKTDKMDWTANKLTFKDGQNPDTLSNSRPLINLNPKKWVTSGKVWIVPAESYWEVGMNHGLYSWRGRNYPTNVNAKGLVMGGLIRGDQDCTWDDSIIGRFFAVTEPTEAIEGKLYRWFEITGLKVNADGTKDITIRRLWWGAKDAGSPSLYRMDNYTWDDHERPLAYAIAPGAFVNDVSKAVPSDDFKTEPVLGVTPCPDAGKAFDFATGDDIEQAIGPDPFKPIPFKMWMWDKVPGAFPSPVLDIANYGVQRYAALEVRGGEENRDDLVNTKEQKPAWKNGIIIDSAAEVGLNCKADFTKAAILFQQPFHEQPVKWYYGFETNKLPKEASLTVSRETGDFNLAGGNLRLNGSLVATGLSADKEPARNLRGKNLPVKVGETTLTVTFVTPEADGDYAVFVEQNWVANRSVVQKEAKGFTVQFEKPAPANAKLDWMIVR